MLGGDIARYDPKTDKLERLKQTIDGKPPTAGVAPGRPGRPPDQLGRLARRQDALLRADEHQPALRLRPDRRAATRCPAAASGRWSPARRAPTAGPCASARRAGCGRRSPRRARSAISSSHLVSYRPGDPPRATTARWRSATRTTPSSPTRRASRCRSTAACQDARRGHDHPPRHPRRLPGARRHRLRPGPPAVYPAPNRPRILRMRAGRGH